MEGARLELEAGANAMPTHAVSYQLASNRDAALGGDHPQRVYTRQLTLAPTFITNPIQTAPLSPGIIPLSAHNPTTGSPYRRVFGSVVTNGPAIAAIEALAGQTWWSFNGAATANTLPAISVSPIVAAGRQVLPYMLQFGGAAFTALDGLAGAVTSFNVSVEIQYPEPLSYSNFCHFLEFEERPPNTQLDGAERLRSLLRKVSSSSARTLLGVPSTGPAIYANACNFAAVAPEGRLWLRPEDIGQNAEQITEFIADNTAERFRFHPSVFVRRYSYIRGISRQNADTGAINDTTLAQPLRITVVEDPVTYSTWLFVVDGEVALVRLNHPQGSDIRRPRDIWNQVIVPLIQGPQSIALALELANVDPAQSSVSLIADRISFLQYARCISVGEAGGNTWVLPPGFDDIPQAGVG